MISDKILIRQNEGISNVAGMEIAEKYIDKPKMGVVVAVGPGWITEKGELISTVSKVGDTVIFQQFANNTVQVEGESYLIMRETIDVHFIIN